MQRSTDPETNASVGEAVSSWQVMCRATANVKAVGWRISHAEARSVAPCAGIRRVFVREGGEWRIVRTTFPIEYRTTTCSGARQKS